MDSRLLNVFHDDPFDGNYAKYQLDHTDLWLNEAPDSMGLQLTETLNEILPITPTEIASNVYDGNILLKDDNVDVLPCLNNKSGFIFPLDFEKEIKNKGISIIDVDPNVSLSDTDVENENISCNIKNKFKNDYDFEKEMNGRLSQCSDITFRTRTDSSSIGDYESHSSDYEDDEIQDIDKEKQLNQNNLILNSKEDDFNDDFSTELLIRDDLTLAGKKKRTFSTNTIGSDVDAFGLQLDANAFDLAEFITKDDFICNTQFQLNHTASDTCSTKIDAVDKPKIVSNLTNQKSLPLTSSSIVYVTNSDCDSDVIVDVETVEVDMEEPLLKRIQQTKSPLKDDDCIPFVDNDKKDPMWDPKFSKKNDKTNKGNNATNSIENRSKIDRKFSVLPSKRQSDILKGKVRENRVCGRKQQVSKSNIIKRNENIIKNKNSGPGGKNLSLIAQQLQNSENDSSPIKQKGISPIKTKFIEENYQKNRIKRKLNLEEYKQRRNMGGVLNSQLNDHCTINIAPTTNNNGVSRLKINEISTNGENDLKEPLKQPNTLQKHSEAVTAIVKSLKDNNSMKTIVTDPITEAKNKVLRMQELKKAQQMKILDSTVSAKVPKVTKLLPLKEIVKDTCYYKSLENDNKEELNLSAKELKLQTQPVYEEIIIVSAGCNTELSIPPKVSVQSVVQNPNLSRSLLKSSALLYNISNGQAVDNIAIRTNSLIASIQDVVVKKVIPSNKCNDVESADVEVNQELNKTEIEYHGEDKVIMHLYRDRMRKKTISTGCQTDLLPEFPPLICFMTVKRKPRERERFRRKLHVRVKRKRKNDVCPNCTDECNSDSSSSSACSTMSSRSNSRSLATNDCASSSSDRLYYGNSMESNINGGYSSRSSCRHHSSESSSYSESEHVTSRNCQRSKRSSRSPSAESSYTDYSDRSRSRSPSKNSNYKYRSNETRRINNNKKQNKNRNYKHVSEPAVEERRIVYVGRIEEETNKDILKRKFRPYGTIKQITIHFKQNGMKYGFVTYEKSEDAFTVIDKSSCDPQINMYDVSFGGRRAFCGATYADLDNAGINTYHSYVYPKVIEPIKEEDSFDALLLQVKAKMNAHKTTTPTPSPQKVNDP